MFFFQRPKNLRGRGWPLKSSLCLAKAFTWCNPLGESLSQERISGFPRRTSHSCVFSRSPIQVLTAPDAAWLRWSDENRYTGIPDVVWCFYGPVKVRDDSLSTGTSPTPIATRRPHIMLVIISDVRMGTNGLRTRIAKNANYGVRRTLLSALFRLDFQVETLWIIDYPVWVLRGGGS